MRTRAQLLGALFAVLQAAYAPLPAAADAVVPTRTGADGIVRYQFPGPAPTLACAPLTVCTIALQNGESVSGLATGDSERWIIATSPSGPGGTTPLVLVKPKEDALRTNLVIATTAHVYYVDLVSSTRWTNSKIAFYYPSEEVAAQNAADAKRAADAVLNAPPVAPDNADDKYTIRGANQILPQRVYNDGVHTYVHYDALPTDLPILVAIAPDGSNQIVNYRLLENTFIVDGVPAGIDLVLNAGTGKHGRGELRVAIRHT
jgi:type IV secretion system protein VirB9